MYPGYQRFFLACDEELRRPQADMSSGHFLRLDRNVPCSRTLSAWLIMHPALDLTGYSISELFIYFIS